MIKQPPVFYFTKEGYEALFAKKDQVTLERKDAVAELTKARNMGDLSENGYYKSARMKLSSIDRQLRELAFQIRYGKVKETALEGIIDIASTVTLSKDGKEYRYSIVGGYESNPSEGKLSYISPLGKALMGKKTGDNVHVATPQGSTTYTILTVE